MTLMMTIETYILWVVYAAALEGAKLRKNLEKIRSLGLVWDESLGILRDALWVRGMTL